MNKLKLTLEELSVESFGTTADATAEPGTVKAYGSDSTCDQRVCTCTGETEWDVSCGSCGMEETCQNTCPTQFNCPTGYYYPGC